MTGPLTKESLCHFIRESRLGVIATASPDGSPEAALVNVAVTSDLEILFETTDATRKFPNLRRNPRAEMVIGWDNDRTLQCRGPVDEPEGREGERLKAAYFAAFPHSTSHQDWPGNHYFRLRPAWVRFSDYNMPRKISECDFPIPESAPPAGFSRLLRAWRRGRDRPQARPAYLKKD